MIHPDIRALINWGAKRPIRCTAKRMDGTRRKRCAYRYSNPQEGHTYAVRHSASLHRWGVCEWCGQIATQHYDYMGMAPAKSPIYKRYWTAAEWRVFADAVYAAHNRINRGPIA